jgi:hypothetical protein
MNGKLATQSHVPRNGCRVSYRHESPKYDAENIRNVTCYRWKQLVLGVDCGLFGGEIK